jgi:beta-glucosidase
MVISDWYAGTPPYSISILKGIRVAVGDNIVVKYAKSNKADSAVIAARQCDVAIVCIGNHPLSYGLGWGQNYVSSDGREDVDRQAISLEQEDLVKLEGQILVK